VFNTASLFFLEGPAFPVLPFKCLCQYLHFWGLAQW